MTDLPRFEAPRIVSGTYSGQTLDEAFDLAMRQLTDAVDRYVNDQLLPKITGLLLEPNSLMTVEELAEYLRKPVKTIYEWNSRGAGPPYMKVGRSVLYRRSDVESWLDGRRSE